MHLSSCIKNLLNLNPLVLFIQFNKSRTLLKDSQLRIFLNNIDFKGSTTMNDTVKINSYNELSFGTNCG